MLAMLNRHATLLGNNEDLPLLLEELKVQRQALLKGESIVLYNSASSGYFYDRSSVDGLETIFTSETVQTMTASKFEELKNTKPNESAGHAVGKMAYGSRWYLAVGFSGSVKDIFKEGTGYGFRLSENADRELTMECVRLIFDSDVGTVAVFASDEIPSDMCFLRRQSVEITVDTCTGYYVPEIAIHHVNGVEGVYIFQDSTVYFRRIEVLYRGDGYVIAAERGDLGKDYLNLFDIMVTYGENLYEGRVYR